MTRHRYRARTPAPYRKATPLVLLAALLGLLVVQEAQVPHVHEAATLGFYNEAHVLDTLAGVSGDAPLPAPPQAGRVMVVAVVGPPSPAVRPAADLARHAEARAPPAA